MKYPDPGEYQEAVQFPSSVFRDPLLQDAEPELGPLGLPRAVTGAFAVVFPMRSRPSKWRAAEWAVKCFLTEVPDQRRRYQAIAAHLQQTPLPYIAEFDYQPDGIRVNGRPFPILKMEWVDGTPISRYIEEHLDHPQTLRALHQKWRVMIRHLDEAAIAHGDLQHGNVLVDADGDIRLVDYDTMYVPPLKGRKSAEVGHRNYQHPDRDESDFNSQIDRFSALVIDTAIQSCILRPDLWTRFDTGENLLFRSSDFYDPASSALFDELVDARDHELYEELARHALVLRMACYGNPGDVPSIDEIEIHAVDAIDETHAVDEAHAVDAAHAMDAIHAIDAIHGIDRKRGRIEGFTVGRSRLRALRGSRSRYEQPVSRSVFERWFAPAAAALLTGSAAALLTGSAAALLLMERAEMAVRSTAILTAIGSLALIAAAGVAAAWWQYRRLPVVRRRHRLMREEAYFSTVVSRLESRLARLKSDREAYLEEKDTEYQRRLEELQEDALRDRLKHHFIAEAGELDGISHKTIVRLKVSGIRTAYQATPERVRNIVQLGDDSKARIILWRAALAAEYEPHIPKKLSPAEERRVRRSIDLRTEELDEEIAHATNKIDLQTSEREQLRVRATELPLPSFGRYLLYLMRLKKNPLPATQVHLDANGRPRRS